MVPGFNRGRMYPEILFVHCLQYSRRGGYRVCPRGFDTRGLGSVHARTAPSPNIQYHRSGNPVDSSVNVTESGADPERGLAENAGYGRPPGERGLTMNVKEFDGPPPSGGEITITGTSPPAAIFSLDTSAESSYGEIIVVVRGRLFHQI